MFKKFLQPAMEYCLIVALLHKFKTYDILRQQTINFI
jgi:hypothetical protein